MRVRTDKGIIADNGAELIYAVIVASNGSGADVHACTHIRIADISKVIYLGVLTNNGFLYFNEVSDMVVSR